MDKESEIPRRSKKRHSGKKAALIAVASLASIAGASGASTEASAQSITPTPDKPTATPTLVVAATSTPTPNVVVTQIAEVEATITALRQKQSDDQKLINLKATEIALVTPPTRTPEPTGTSLPRPTLYPIEAEATSETIRLKALGEKQAAIKATATADAAPSATAQANQTVTAINNQTASRGQSEQNQGGIPGFLWGILGVAGGTIFANRARIANSRAVKWTRQRFGRGGPPAAPTGPAVPPGNP